jgi:hypothetical protein
LIEELQAGKVNALFARSAPHGLLAVKLVKHLRGEQ